MSAWSLLLACQGFHYDGPRGMIGFRPVWQPEDHVSFFTAAEGWGVFRQKQSPQAWEVEIAVREGKLPVTEIVLSRDRLDDPPVKVRATIGESDHFDRYVRAEGRLRILLKAATTVDAGSRCVS